MVCGIVEEPDHGYVTWFQIRNGKGRYRSAVMMSPLPENLAIECTKVATNDDGEEISLILLYKTRGHDDGREGGDMHIELDDGILSFFADNNNNMKVLHSTIYEEGHDEQWRLRGLGGGIDCYPIWNPTESVTPERSAVAET